MNELWTDEVKYLKKYSKRMMFVGLAVAVILPPCCYYWKVRMMRQMEDGAWDDIHRMMEKGRRFDQIPNSEIEKNFVSSAADRKKDIEDMKNKLKGNRWN